MLDSNCKPWLIEINSSPSLSTTTKSDHLLKTDVLKSIYEIVIPEDWGEDYNKFGANTNQQTRVGGFSMLYDETQDMQNRKNLPSKRNVNKIWR